MLDYFNKTMEGDINYKKYSRLIVNYDFNYKFVFSHVIGRKWRKNENKKNYGCIINYQFYVNAIITGKRI